MSMSGPKTLRSSNIRIHPTLVNIVMLFGALTYFSKIYELA